MCKMIKWYEGHKELIAVITSIGTCVIGVVALVVSIANAVFVGRQTKINEQLYQLQLGQIQPLFEISTTLEYNSDNTYFETEHLYIRNKGSDIKSFESSDFVVCEVVRWNGANYKLDTTYAIIDDYFFISNRYPEDDGVLEHSFDKGNNKKFYDLYIEAISNNTDGFSYFLNMVLLVRIDYTDLMNDRHSLYYLNKREVDRREFVNLLGKVSDENHFSIDRITFVDLKTLFD